MSLPEKLWPWLQTSTTAANPATEKEAALVSPDRDGRMDDQVAAVPGALVGVSAVRAGHPRANAQRETEAAARIRRNWLYRAGPWQMK